jgi:repressor LexA
MSAVAELEEWRPEATVEIPLMGHVAAGEPFEAFELHETLDVPAGLWPASRVFALRVRGSSMIDEGIHDGDYLIVQPRDTADSGQTVVAEVDGAVTVKKFHRGADGEVRLQPANAEMLPLVIRGDHVRIRGVVVGVMRKHGFQRQPPRPRLAARGPRRVPPAEDPTLDLEANALDAQIARWESALARARRERRPRHQLVQMEDLGRDLQALRDWCARTGKPALRRALLAEANRVLRRMQRFR